MSSCGRLRCEPLCLYSLVEHQGRQCYLLSPSLSRTGSKDSVRSGDGEFLQKLVSLGPDDKDIIDVPAPHLWFPGGGLQGLHL